MNKPTILALTLAMGLSLPTVTFAQGHGNQGRLATGVENAEMRANPNGQRGIENAESKHAQHKKSKKAKKAKKNLKRKGNSVSK
jgi:hypothetical protein